MMDARITMVEAEVARQRALLTDLLTREMPTWMLAATGVGAAAVTLLEAGTVQYVITLLFVVRAVTGADTSGGTVTLALGDNFSIYNDGTDVLTLTLTAGGALTAQRTAGADTFDVKVLGVWL